MLCADPMSGRAPVWVRACERVALVAGGMREVEAGGAALLLFDVAGQVFATAAICPHHAGWLSQGEVDGEYVNCPRHMGRFHIPTGEQARGPDCPALRVYAVRVADGSVYVAV